MTAAPACVTGFLTAYPCGGGRPLASNVNPVAGSVVAGFAIVPLAAGATTFCLSSLDPGRRRGRHHRLVRHRAATVSRRWRPAACSTPAARGARLAAGAAVAVATPGRGRGRPPCST